MKQQRKQQMKQRQTADVQTRARNSNAGGQGAKTCAESMHDRLEPAFYIGICATCFHDEPDAVW